MERRKSIRLTGKKSLNDRHIIVAVQKMIERALNEITKDFKHLESDKVLQEIKAL